MEQLLKKLELVYGKKIKDYFLEKTECYNFNKTDREIVQTFVSYELGYYNEQIGEITLLRKIIIRIIMLYLHDFFLLV